MNKPALIILFTILIGHDELAQSADSSTSSELSELSLGIERSLYFDTYLFSGFSILDHVSLTDKAQGAVSGIGFSIGTRLGSMYLVGVTTDYRWLSQTSSVDDSHPNFTGKRFLPIAPFLGLKLDSYLFKFDYQTLGNFEVSKSVPEGGTIKFTNPIGFRFSALFDRLFDKYPWGIYYENTTYKKKGLSDVGEVVLTSKFNTWQLGATIVVIF